MHSYYVILLSFVIGVHSYAYSFNGESSNSKSGSASSSESGTLKVNNVPGYSSSGSFSKSQSSSFAASSASSFNFQGSGPVPLPLPGQSHAPDEHIQGNDVAHLGLTYLGSPQDVGLPDITGAVSVGYAGVQILNTNGGYSDLNNSGKRKGCNVCSETGLTHILNPPTNENYPGHKNPTSNTYRPSEIHEHPTVYPGLPNEDGYYEQPALGQHSQPVTFVKPTPNGYVLAEMPLSQPDQSFISTSSGKINGGGTTHTGVYKTGFNGAPGNVSPQDIIVQAGQVNVRNPIKTSPQNVNSPYEHDLGSVPPKEPQYSSYHPEQQWQKDKTSETGTHVRTPEGFNGPPGILSPYDTVVPADKYTQHKPNSPSNIGNFELSGDDLSANIDSEESYYENGYNTPLKPSKGVQNKPRNPSLQHPQHVNVPHNNIVGSVPGYPKYSQNHPDQQWQKDKNSELETNVRVPGGFNGPPGILSPYDIPISADKGKQPDTNNLINTENYEVSGGTSIRIDNGENYYENVYVHPQPPTKGGYTATPPYTEGFDGPPGILSPYDIIVPTDNIKKANKPISQEPHQTPSLSVYPDIHTPNGEHKRPLTSYPEYTGDFGGRPGVLKPIEQERPPKRPSATYSPEHRKPNHVSNTRPIQSNNNNTPLEIPTYSHTPINDNKPLQPPGPQYTGGFGGPPGVLKPIESERPPKQSSATYTPERDTPIHGEPIEPNYDNFPPEIPTNSPTAVNDHKTPLATGPQYTGGFGGPPGVLKPIETEIPHKNPSATYKPEHEKPNHVGNTRPIQSNNNNTPLEIPTYSHKPINDNKPLQPPGPQYTGGFGGPPGVLRPIESERPPKHPSATYSPELETSIYGEPIKPNHDNFPPEIPTFSPTPVNDHKTPLATGPQYTGGFGGPPGVLRPIETEIPHKNPSATYKPEYEKPNHVGNTRPIESNYENFPPEIPTYSPTPVNDHKTPLATGPQYTGGFGGPPGVLRPIETKSPHKNPSATYKPEHEKPDHVGNTRPIQSNYENFPPEIPTYSPTPLNDHKTPLATGPQYTGGFGGPPGVLKPIETKSPHKNPSATYKPEHEKPDHLGNTRPIESNYENFPPEIPTYSRIPENDDKTQSTSGPLYTGGFGGPPGVLKPIEFDRPPKYPSATYTPGHDTLNHRGNTKPIDSTFSNTSTVKPEYPYTLNNDQQIPEQQTTVLDNQTPPQKCKGSCGGSDLISKQPNLSLETLTEDGVYEISNINRGGNKCTGNHCEIPVRHQQPYRPNQKSGVSSPESETDNKYYKPFQPNPNQSSLISTGTSQTESGYNYSSEQQTTEQDKKTPPHKCKGSCGDSNLKPKQPSLSLETPTEDYVNKEDGQQNGYSDDNKCIGNNCKIPARQPQHQNPEVSSPESETDEKYYQPYRPNTKQPDPILTETRQPYRPSQNTQVGSPESETNGEKYISFQPNPVPSGNQNTAKPSAIGNTNIYPSDFNDQSNEPTQNRVNCKSGNCDENDEDIQLDQRFATNQPNPEDQKPIAIEAPAKRVGCNGVCKRRPKPQVVVNDEESTSESVYPSYGIKNSGCKSGCSSLNRVQSLPIGSFVAASGGVYTPTLVISSRPACPGGCNGKNQMSYYNHGFAGSGGLAFSSAGSASQTGGSFVPVITGNEYYNDGRNNAGGFFNKLFSGISEVGGAGASSAASSGSYAYSGSSAGSASASGAFSSASAGAGYGSRHYRSSRYY